MLCSESVEQVVDPAMMIKPDTVFRRGVMRAESLPVYILCHGQTLLILIGALGGGRDIFGNTNTICDK